MTFPTRLGPADPSSIDISSPLEVRWWCGWFGVTEKELCGAVAKVGTDAGARVARGGR
jgi:hypothetical protein